MQPRGNVDYQNSVQEIGFEIHVLEYNKIIIFLKDADILASYFPPSTQMAYILSLGVISDYRRQGIGMCYLYY